MQAYRVRFKPPVPLLARLWDIILFSFPELSITLQVKTPSSTATVTIFTDAMSGEGGSGLVVYVGIGLSSAVVALIAAAVIIISVTVCLVKRKKRKYRTDDCKNNGELRGDGCYSIKPKEDTIYDHLTEGNATYNHMDLAIAHINGNSMVKQDTAADDTYDHLPASLPKNSGIYAYVSIAIGSDSDIITTQNEAYANSSDISVSINEAYGMSYHK